MAGTAVLWQIPSGPGRADEALKALTPKRVGVSLRPWPSLDDEAINRFAEQLALIPEVKAGGINLIDCHSGADIVPLAKLGTSPETISHWLLLVFRG